MTDEMSDEASYIDADVFRRGLAMLIAPKSSRSPGVGA
jgi:hypothetical protein